MNRQIYDNYVFQVVKHGSLTSAAKALHISQPALSQGLNALEKEIGIKIFNRRANPITMTEEGEMYYRHISRINVLNADFEKELAAKRMSAENKVVIGAPAVYVGALVAPAIAAMERKDAQVFIKTASIEKLITLADAGEIDCFISTTKELPGNFVKELLYQEQMVLCVPLASDITEVTDRVLSENNFIFLEEEMPMQQAVNAYLQKRGIVPHHSITVDQAAQAVRLVELGLGAAFAAKEAAEGRAVKTIPVDIVGREIWLSYDKELFKTTSCEALIEAIRDIKKNLI